MIDIEGYEGLYAVTSTGRIWSYPKQGTGGHSGKWLKPNITPNGYMKVVLVKDKIKTGYLVHRLVARSYLVESAKPHVNHKDGDKQNNCTTNLEWCTASENELHSYDVLKKEASRHCLGKTGYESHRGKEVIQYTLDGIEVARYGSGREAAKAVNGIQSSISAVCIGKRNKHKGFIWKYN